MATPLNVFKTVTASLTDSDRTIYTTPLGITTIVLMAQVSNVDSADASYTFSHFDVTDETQTELVKDFPIPPRDASSAITGKLVVEQNDEIRIQASRSNALKVTLSILESLNA